MIQKVNMQLVVPRTFRIGEKGDVVGRRSGLHPELTVIQEFMVEDPMQDCFTEFSAHCEYTISLVDQVVVK